MTLRRRLALRYGAVVGVCFLLLGGLAYHEFVEEPHVRRLLGQVKPSGSAWGEVAEMVLHALIPVVLGGGWWFLRRVLVPLDALAAGVDRIQAENLREPLPRSNSGDEVDRLTAAFNRTTARLHQSFEHVREFTLHASHELKTPLTVMRGQLESALREPMEDSEARREWMLAQLDEIQRLAGLVDSLTLLAKADAGILAMERQVVDMAELVRELGEDLLILAEPRSLRVELTVRGPARVEGDRHRLRQLLLNLADNAVKYNQPRGVVSVWLSLTADGQARFRIRNTGRFIPAGETDRLFGRFVRGDRADLGQVDGAGLGLSICRSIAEAHGGSIAWVSSPEGWNEVSVDLPARQGAEGAPAEERELRLMGGAGSPLVRMNESSSGIHPGFIDGEEGDGI